MIPLKLQDYLVKVELPELFDGFTLKNVGGQYVPLNIYSQYLPVKKKKNDTDHFPFLTVILVKGREDDEDSPHQCNLLFMTGVYDEDETFKGYRDSVNVIQKLYEHLMTKRIFDNRFEITYPIEWELPEEELYPFFYAGLSTTWFVGKVLNIDLYS